MRLMKRQSIVLPLVALLASCKASTISSAPAPAHASHAPAQVPAEPTAPLSSAIVGKPCRVSLRRDALGMSAPGFAEPMTPMIGGKPALLAGTVEKLTDNWLVLRDKSKTYWIPVGAILMVEFEAK